MTTTNKPGAVMRTDFESLEDGARVQLYPLPNNPLHREPVMATYASGYFYCDGTKPTEWPDYAFNDVLKFNAGFTLPAPPTDSKGAA